MTTRLLSPLPAGSPSLASAQVGSESALAQGFRKILSIISRIVESWDEARAMQQAARSRFPFADW